MKRRTPCILCAILLAAAAAMAPAQARTYDALARARAKAKAENQRLLLLLTGGEAATEAALTEAMRDYQSLGKLLRYEYQLVALPADSEAARALRRELRITEVSWPALVVLDSEDRVLGQLGADQLVGEVGLAIGTVRGFLAQRGCPPLDARAVLAAGLEQAKKTDRQLFVYLSAPW